VEERVEQGPVRDRIRPIAHRFSLTIRRSDGTGIEVIAPDHDRAFDFPCTHTVIDRETELSALAVPEPADARGQALKVNALLGQTHPTSEHFIVWEQFQC